MVNIDTISPADPHSATSCFCRNTTRVWKYEDVLSFQIDSSLNPAYHSSGQTRPFETSHLQGEPRGTGEGCYATPLTLGRLAERVVLRKYLEGVCSST